MSPDETEEIKRHFGVVADGLRSEIRLVAEGLGALDTKVDDFRKEVQAEFREVRALIKFSYADLDERVKNLERDMLMLKTRLDRIEAS